MRTAITTYYTYRIDSVTNHLEEQQTERTKTIDKLKAATKYNSTQQLLEKYGGAPPQASQKPKAQPGAARKPNKGFQQPHRTNMGPPATANIPQNQPPLRSPSSMPQLAPQPMFQNRIPQPVPQTPIPMAQPGPPEFAPNAYAAMPQYDRTPEANTDGRWYDRILDLLLGEDETSPKHRIVLICKHCRLVNGQAPPGIKRTEELGKWRCIGCGGWNGEVDEGAKIVEEMRERADNEAQVESEKAEMSKSVESMSEEDLGDTDDKSVEDEDYEEVKEAVIEKEGGARKTRSGRRKAAQKGES